jgi:hypothetical protein
VAKNKKPVEITRIKGVINAGVHSKTEGAVLVETDSGDHLDLVFHFRLAPILKAGIAAAGRYVGEKLDPADDTLKMEWPRMGVKTAKAYPTEEGYFEIATRFYGGPEICFELPPEALAQLLEDLQKIYDNQIN